MNNLRRRKRAATLVGAAMFLPSARSAHAADDPMSGEDLQQFVRQYDGLSPDLLEGARKARE